MAIQQENKFCNLANIDAQIYEKENNKHENVIEKS